MIETGDLRLGSPLENEANDVKIEEKSSQLQMMIDKCERLEEYLADKERKIVDLEKRLKHSEGKNYLPEIRTHYFCVRKVSHFS